MTMTNEVQHWHNMLRQRERVQRTPRLFGLSVQGSRHDGAIVSVPACSSKRLNHSSATCDNDTNGAYTLLSTQHDAAMDKTVHTLRMVAKFCPVRLAKRHCCVSGSTLIVDFAHAILHIAVCQAMALPDTCKARTSRPRFLPLPVTISKSVGAELICVNNCCLQIDYVLMAHDGAIAKQRGPREKYTPVISSELGTVVKCHGK